jgi:hypothetical protein
LEAIYSGGGHYSGSTSPTIVVTVLAVATSTSLAAEPTEVKPGDDVTLTATVTSGSGTPTGDVIFYDGVTPIGLPVTLDPDGTATLHTSFFTVGPHVLTAAYQGEGSFTPSTSGPVTVTVSAILTPTTIALVAIPTTFVPNANVRLTATVTPASGPTGTVQFLDTTTGAILGSADVSDGVAVLNTTAIGLPPAGPHSLQAIYSGDTTYAGSTSPSIVVVVTAPTVTTLTVSPSTSVFRGQAVTFTATVTPTTPTTPLPTGTVTFFDGPTVLGTVPLSATGQAVLTSANLAIGTHLISATYGGDSNFLGSTSNSVTVTVLPSLLLRVARLSPVVVCCTCPSRDGRRRQTENSSWRSVSSSASSFTSVDH